MREVNGWFLLRWANKAMETWNCHKWCCLYRECFSLIFLMKAKVHCFLINLILRMHKKSWFAQPVIKTKNFLPPVCRLTAGRTPPIPPQSPPLKVLLAVSTQTPPTDWVAPPFPPRSAPTPVLCPHFSPLSLVSQPNRHTGVYSLFINTNCAGTQDSWRVVGRAEYTLYFQH